MTRTIFCNATFPDALLLRLRQSVGSDRLRLARATTASNLVAGEAEPAMLNAEIIFGQPDPARLGDCANLRWIHLSSAGYSRYDTEEVRRHLAQRGVRLTTSSSVYAEPCAEHLLAMVLALSRGLPESWREQTGSRRWQSAERRHGSALLRGQRVVLLGYGAIARRLAELLRPFGVTITALRRHADDDDAAPVSVITAIDLPEALSRADHLVNALPDTASTHRLVDGALFAHLPKGARYYSVGRGSTTDHQALARRLHSGQLGAAYLDVTDPEPLPASHPLWDAPNCYITPHSAGGSGDEFYNLVQHFLENLARYDAGEPLRDRVDNPPPPVALSPLWPLKGHR